MQSSLCNSIVLFHIYFTPSGEQPELRIVAHKSEQPTAGCTQLLLLYKIWEYYNKFDSYEILGDMYVLIC